MLIFVFVTVLSMTYCKVMGKCYPTEKQCKGLVEDEMVEYEEGGCGVSQDFGGTYSLVCTNKNNAWVYGNCNSDCTSCTISTEVGGCMNSTITLTMQGKTYQQSLYCHVECSMGYISTGLIAFGAGLMGLGLVLCLCCFWIICCPLGLCFIFIGLCVGCC